MSPVSLCLRRPGLQFPNAPGFRSWRRGTTKHRTASPLRRRPRTSERDLSPSPCSHVELFVTVLGLAPDVPEGRRHFALRLVLQDGEMAVPAAGNVHGIGAVGNLAMGEG